MKNDLETMIRSSLRDRAEDVEPTPELWTRVDRGISRRRLVPGLVWGAGLTAAAVTAAVVIPGVLDGGDRSVVVEPLGGNSAPAGVPEAGALAGLVPNHYLAADGEALVMRSLDGTHAEQTLHVADRDILAIEVRPGSTAESLVALITVEMGDRHELHLVTVGAGPVKDQLFATVTATADETPQAIWSPEGTRVAWAGATDGLEGSLFIAEMNGDAVGAPEVAAIPPDGMWAADAVAQDWDVVGDREQLIVVGDGRAYAADLDAGATSPSSWERYSPGAILPPGQAAAAPVLPETLIDVVASPTATWALLRVDEEIRLQMWGADGEEVSAVSWAWDPEQPVQLTGAGEAILLAAGQQSMLETSPVEVDGGPWPWSGTHTSVSSFDIVPTSAAAFLPVADEAIPNTPDGLEGRVVQPAQGRGEQEAEDATTVEVPNVEAPAAVEGVPGYYLAIVEGTDSGRADEDAVHLRSVDGSVDTTIGLFSFQGADDGIRAVAVAPDATERDLRYVSVASNAGQLDLIYRHVAVEGTRIPSTDQLALNGDMGADPSRPDVVWSPDGQYVGWLTADGSAFRVVDVASWLEAIDAAGGDERRVVGGPGFGPDNATIDVALEQPLDRLDGWVLDEEGRLSIVGGAGENGSVIVVLEGWEPVEWRWTSGPALAFDFGGHTAWDRLAVVSEDEQGTFTLGLGNAREPVESDALSGFDLETLDRAPSTLWLDATGDGVLLGYEGFRYFVTHDDERGIEIHDLPDDVVRAAFVPASTPWDRATAPPAD